MAGFSQSTQTQTKSSSCHRRWESVTVPCHANVTLAAEKRCLGAMLRSVGDISRINVEDSEKESLTPRDMITEIYLDNRELTGYCV
jgi:hypothetical protein